MISCKQELYEYLREDEIALHLMRKRWVSKLINPIYKYERALRFDEYCTNCFRHFWQIPFKIFARIRHRNLGIKYGFSIPVNVFGKGLAIVHVGTIVVSDKAQIGDYCRIHVCTNIGSAAGAPNAVPHIGNRVYIGPGVKMFGDITIADDIAIGANAVVNKSFETPGITIGGIPAKQIGRKGSYNMIFTD